MVFSSSIFLLVFLPICLLVYYLVPGRPTKNVVLFAASLVFYAWGEPVYIILMLISILVNWACGIALGKLTSKNSSAPGHPRRRNARIVLILNLICNLGLLGFFKYEAFLAGNINALAGFSLVPVFELPLPIGISFYTLQAISYVVDVYKGKVPYQRNLLYLGMYIAMFPQLVAGPIVRYSTVWEQIRHRKESLAKFCSGIRLFCIGMAKKVLLANVVAVLATSMLEKGGPEIGAIGAWAGLIAFTFQIFFDFAGYSDMAIGLGKMFGFEYLRNFNYPYISKSVTEFWRRWHISLGTFFRDYVYIPMGGNRVSRARWVVNLLVVWFLTGFWHGAAWNYVAWGLFYGVLLGIEKLWLGKWLDRAPSPIAHLYAIVAFVAGWFIFWIEDPSVAFGYGQALFGAFGATGNLSLWELQAWSYLPVFIVCAIASTPLIPWLSSRLMAWVCMRAPEGITRTGMLANVKSSTSLPQCNPELLLDEARKLNAPSSRIAFLNFACLLGDVACLVLLVLSIMSLASGSFNPFIYFRF